MAHKKRVPKTKSYTKYICSECEKPVELQTNICGSCKADVSRLPSKMLYANLLMIAAFLAFTYYAMN